VFAIETLFEQRGQRLPVIVSGTITDQSGRTLTGQTPEAFWNSVSHARPIAVGLNCALGQSSCVLHRGIVERRRYLHQLLSQRRAAESPVRTGYDETPEYTSSLLKNSPTAAS